MVRSLSLSSLFGVRPSPKRVPPMPTCEDYYGFYSTIRSRSKSPSTPSSSTPSLKMNTFTLLYKATEDVFIDSDTQCHLKHIRYDSDFFLHLNVDHLIVKGILDKKIIKWIASAGRIATIELQRVRIHCSPKVFAQFISSMSTDSISFNCCTFDDAQLICDDFFSRNPQLTNVKITATDEDELQSFPLLTDKTLRLWSHGLRYPHMLHLHNVVTSFTIQGIEQILEMTLSKKAENISWTLGRIGTRMGESLRVLQKLPEEIQTFPYHRRHIHVFSDVIPNLYIFFYTLPYPSEEDSGEHETTSLCDGSKV